MRIYKNRYCLFIIFLLLIFYCIQNTKDLVIKISKTQTFIRDINFNKKYSIINSDSESIKNISDSIVLNQMKLVRSNKKNVICDRGILIYLDTNLSFVQFYNIIKYFGESGMGIRKQPCILGCYTFYVDMDMFYYAGDYNNEHGIIEGAPKLIVNGPNKFQFIQSNSKISNKYSGAINLIANQDFELKYLISILHKIKYVDYQFLHILINYRPI